MGATKRGLLKSLEPEDASAVDDTEQQAPLCFVLMPFSKKMDCRVKPGNDNLEHLALANRVGQPLAAGPVA